VLRVFWILNKIDSPAAHDKIGSDNNTEKSISHNKLESLHKQAATAENITQ